MHFHNGSFVWFAAIVIAVSIALFGSGPAVAQTAEKGFELCNRTDLNVVYATALNTTTAEQKKAGKALSFDAEGWFNLSPSECKIIWPGALKYRYYLIYAEAKASNRKWTGDISVCVQSGQFKMTSTGSCPKDKNYRMFVQVDTGEKDLSYTYDLR